jgi:hypothetical protein
VRNKKFQNTVIKSLGIFHKRLQKLKKISKNSQHNVQKLRDNVKELEVDHIFEQAVENEHVTYYKVYFACLILCKLT